ncbi:MAG TPA: hypothetical protein H9866_05335 [Candidatus Tidjanibacter gallistercoris]|nr:hypothetical protein [Candidatus Tidjanibacter gallistercoris]
MKTNMIRKLLITVCAAVFAAGTVEAQERAFHSRDAQPDLYELYPRYSFHEVSLSYGILSINDITSIMTDLFPSLAGTQIAERWGTGSINFGYTYRLTPALTVGGIFGYSGNMSDVVDEVQGFVYKNFYSILPQVKFEWYRSGIVTLYSRLAAGVLIANIQGQHGAEIDDELTAAAFTFQVSPIGIELGRSVAGFAEAGFGATGVFTLGVRARF